jgi:alpha-tubulin suppressor-like RCC1 family protein
VAFCWGYNAHGQLGNGGTISRAIPTQVLSGAFDGVSPGGGHTCGVRSNDQVLCWGMNFAGQLGDGTAGTDRLVPVAVTGGLRFGPINAGLVHTCAVTTDNRAYCWGANNVGQLGTGTKTWSAIPVPVAGPM